MFCFSSRLFLILALGISSVSCGQLPKPFKSDPGGGAESPLVALQDSVGVIVAPITGAPPGVAGPLADIMAAELRRANVPATTASAVKNAFLLEGQAVVTQTGGDQRIVAIDWTITNGAGDLVSQIETRSVVPGEIWELAKRAPMEAVSADAVPRITDVLQTKFEGVAQRPRPTIAVVAIEGAPGDGNEALRQAFTAVLKNAGLPVAADPLSAAIQIFGKVDVSDQTSGREKLKIEWSLRESDGSEIGTMTQSNSIEKGRATSKWGPLAYDVTFAMVDSIADVLLTMERADDIRQGR